MERKKEEHIASCKKYLGLLMPYFEKGIATHSSTLAWRIPMERGNWWATVHRVIKSQTLSD